jgi:predicted ATP-binding protein involved in virulence
MKITSMSFENAKRVKLVTLNPKSKGATIIGGTNNSGKTSILDLIVYALGGERYKPSNLKRDGAIGDPIIHIETDDGLVIERRGKNSDLHVTDSTGRKAGQTLLDSLVSKFALDLPKFMNASVQQKTQMLLDLIPEKEELLKLDADYKAKENTRLLVGREADKKRKAAEDLPFYEDAPEEKLSAADLIKQQQEVLARNGLKEEHRRNYEANVAELARLDDEIKRLVGKREMCAAAIQAAQGEDFTLESTAELEKQIADFESINEQVSANAMRRERLLEADDLDDQYKTLTAEMADIKKRRVALLSNAKLPYDGLSISPESGELTLNGKSWDCMSGSQQLVVAASIASRLNPKLRLVLVDKTEQIDIDNMHEFDEWCEANDVQCICTRVSSGEECSIVLTDGEVAVNNLPPSGEEEEY